ncbi:MAG TPA: cupin domain-containing protein [Candidatus Udaeobacter sp.]|nr:cupin domain-containing protein [Candidatus Udaeobacter sp.]
MTEYRTQPDDSVVHCEKAEFPSLTTVNLSREAASVAQAYRNSVIFNVNDHCVRLAVMEGEFRWHQHPHSDECFLVLEGELEIDLAGGKTFRLKPGEAFIIPAGAVHRTGSRTRAVSLCFENQKAYTDVIFEESVPAKCE